MIIRLFILFLFLGLSHVILPVASGQNNSSPASQQASDNREPKQSENNVEPDSVSYSADAHEEYRARFDDVITQSDAANTDRWKQLLGVDSWKSVDLYKNLRDDIQVLGWHPYWAEDARFMYDYETLSMISYYGYDFNPLDGSGLHPERWDSTKVLNEAYKYKESVELLLTVFAYDSSDHVDFFDNPDAIFQLVDDVTKSIDAKEAHGVTLDFQNIPHEYRQSYVSLVQRFSEQMAPKDQLISIVIPAVDNDSLIAVSDMVDFLDYVIVMGYDFHGTGDQKGPFSVLYDTGEPQTSSIEKSVNRLRGEEVGISPEKILVSLGWIGSLHQMQNGEHEHLGYRSYGYMKKALSDSAITAGAGGELTITDDKSTRSNSVTYPVENSTAVRTYYYADTTNFGLNLDWIQKDSLGGVAIWTLADAGNADDYWKMLVKYFGRPPPSIMTNVILPLRDFIVEEWLHPYLSLFLSIVIIFLFLVALIYISYYRSVPEWLRKLGVFLPCIIFFMMLFSLAHDALALKYVKPQLDYTLETRLSLLLGSLVLFTAFWYCVRVYYLDRRKIP